MCRYIGNQEEKEGLRKHILQSPHSFSILVTTYSYFSLTFDYSNSYLFVVTRMALKKIPVHTKTTSFRSIGHNFTYTLPFLPFFVLSHSTRLELPFGMLTAF